MIIYKEHKKRLNCIEYSFSDYKKAFKNGDNKGVYEALNRICNLYGKDLETRDINDVKNLLENGDGKLKW